VDGTEFGDEVIDEFGDNAIYFFLRIEYSCFGGLEDGDELFGLQILVAVEPFYFLLQQLQAGLAGSQILSMGHRHALSLLFIMGGIQHLI
jgi:hypothetical protein